MTFNTNFKYEHLHEVFWNLNSFLPCLGPTAFSSRVGYNYLFMCLSLFFWTLRFLATEPSSYLPLFPRAHTDHDIWEVSDLEDEWMLNSGHLS